MSRQHKIEEYVLIRMNNFLKNEKQINKIAHSRDMFFISNGAWLKDAAVIDSINKRQGGVWDLSLIFAHYQNPLQLIVRNITKCFSEQKAKATAFYIRKGAAKDRRGTLCVSIKDLNLCSN